MKKNEEQRTKNREGPRLLVSIKYLYVSERLLFWPPGRTSLRVREVVAEPLYVPELNLSTCQSGTSLRVRVDFELGQYSFVFDEP